MGDVTTTEDVSFENDLIEEGGNTEGTDSKSISPLRTLRRYCLWCCNGSANEVRLCAAKRCPLWTFRFGNRATPEDKAVVADGKLYPLERLLTGGEFHDNGGTALKAIRRRCIDCSGGSSIGANGCTASDCNLHPFRQGKNPNFRISGAAGGVGGGPGCGSSTEWRQKRCVAGKLAFLGRSTLSCVPCRPQARWVAALRWLEDAGSRGALATGDF
jgi:hypothetical protein